MAFRYWCCLDPVALVHNSRDSIQASTQTWAQLAQSLNKTCVSELTLLDLVEIPFQPKRNSLSQAYTVVWHNK